MATCSINPWCPLDSFCSDKKRIEARKYADYSDEIQRRLNNDCCPIGLAIEEAARSYAGKVYTEARGLVRYMGTIGETDWEALSKEFPFKREKLDAGH
jgi:hypothetical protein